MTHSNAASLSDELLVAYLDDELDPEHRRYIDYLLPTESPLAARLDRLKRGELPFREAFDSMLDEAPAERLQAMLDSLPPAVTHPKATLSRRGFLAAAASFMLAGIAADRLFTRWQNTDAHDGWRASVAEYMVLYTPGTLDHLSPDVNSHIAQLDAIGRQLGLPLTPAAITLPGAEFRRAQILDYEGVPIGQLTYLDARHGPLALCITPHTTGSATLASEKRKGLNVVYWSSPSHAFMLIGKNPFEDLRIMAATVQNGLPA